jgi:DNA ligase (NAD+)
MLTKKSTKAEIDAEHKLLVHAAEAYYNDSEGQGTRVMTDEEFDDRKQAWEAVTGKRFQVGAKPKNVSATVTLSHGYKNLMGTLDKNNSVDELHEWAKRRGFLKRKVMYGVSLKYDGHSLMFEYEDNMLSAAGTRGQDGVGKDLTGYFKKARDGFYNIMKIDHSGVKDFAIAFEAVISWECLDKLNEEFGTNYKNPRSAIGGIIKDDGLAMAKYLTLIPLKFRVKDRPDGNLTRRDELQILDMIAEGVKSELFDKMEYFTANGIRELDETYAAVAAGRLEMKYMIDGLVVEVLDEDVREELGYADDRPNFATALKFPYIEKETKALDVTWYTEGNSATYTPVVQFEPVKLNGNTYQNTSIANYARFNELKLRPGDRLTFQLRNEVLGWVDKLETVGNKAKPFKAPTHCEYCDSELVTDEVFLFCANQACDLVKVGNLQQFIDKLKIKGVQRATIEALYVADLIKEVPDFMNLDYNAISKLEGFGKASAKKLQDAIEGKLDAGLKDYELLGALNIPLISVDRAKTILKHVSLFALLNSASAVWRKHLMIVDGIGEKICDALELGLTDKKEVLQQMLPLVKVTSYKEKTEVVDDGSPKYTLCITGPLHKYKDRDAFREALEAKGHKVVNGVTKKTDFLITNDTGSGTVKNQKAADLKIPILNEVQTIEKFGLNSRAGEKVTSLDDM